MTISENTSWFQYWTSTVILIDKRDPYEEQEEQVSRRPRDKPEQPLYLCKYGRDEVLRKEKVLIGRRKGATERLENTPLDRTPASESTCKNFTNVVQHKIFMINWFSEAAEFSIKADGCGVINPASLTQIVNFFYHWLGKPGT